MVVVTDRGQSQGSEPRGRVNYGVSPAAMRSVFVRIIAR